MLVALLLGLAFSAQKAVELQTDPGWVASVVATPGGLLVSNYDFIATAAARAAAEGSGNPGWRGGNATPRPVPRPEQGELFLFDNSGQLQKRVALSSLGIRGLGNVAWTGEALLLSDFTQATVTVVDTQLEKKRQVLLRGKHPHPYNPRYLAYWPKGRRLFVTGRYPLKGYLDLDCLYVHEYSGEELRHLASSLELPPEREAWGVKPIVPTLVAGVSSKGEVWVVLETGGKGFRRRPNSNTWEALDFNRYAFAPQADPRESERQRLQALAKAYLASGVFFLPSGSVAVAYASAAEDKSRVIFFSPSGKAQKQLEIPGRVVGLVEGLVVVAWREGNWKLSFLALE